MSDDLDDIEYLLEAPYKQDEIKKQESSSALTNGTHNGKSSANGDQQTPMEAASEDSSAATRDKDSKESTADVEMADTKDKKAKKKDRSRSREKKKHRRSSRSRSHSRSKKSKRSRSRSGSRSKKSRRSRSRSSRRRSKSRDRRRSRSHSHDRKRRTKSRSHSRSRRHRSRSPNRRSRTKSRERRHRPSPKRREKSPELTPEERDFRTVFCMQLAARIRPRDLEEFFSSVGKVRDVRLITDPRTKRSKGIAYIEFRDLESVPLAIALTGQRLLGVPIIVKLTQAEKNRNPLPVTAQAASLPTFGPMKLYVGSLHVNISEDMLKGIFEPFGKIDSISLSKDEMNRSRGYGYIQFFNAEDAKKAMEQLNGFEIAGRPMQVKPFNEKSAQDTAMGLLDDHEEARAGVNLGPSGKLALMAKLAEGTGLTVPKVPTATPGLPILTSNGIADLSPGKVVEAPNSPCVLLSNMFDLEEERANGADWAQELQDDVIEECSKYGGVVHISVDQNSPEGNIYVKCSTIAFALSAVVALNGRYFAGRQIKASFVPLSEYHQRFPDSVNCHQILKPLT